MKNLLLKTLQTSMILVFLSGCASNWQQAGKTQNDLIADKYACNQQSISLYPPLVLYTPFQAGYLYPSLSTYDDPYAFRPFRGKRYVPLPRDYNEQARKKAFNDCLHALGWEWVFEW